MHVSAYRLVPAAEQQHISRRTHLTASCLALLFRLIVCMPVMTLSFAILRMAASSSTASPPGFGFAATVAIWGCCCCCFCRRGTVEKVDTVESLLVVMQHTNWSKQLMRPARGP